MIAMIINANYHYRVNEDVNVIASNSDQHSYNTWYNSSTVGGIQALFDGQNDHMIITASVVTIPPRSSEAPGGIEFRLY